MIKRNPSAAGSAPNPVDCSRPATSRCANLHDDSLKTNAVSTLAKLPSLANNGLPGHVACTSALPLTAAIISGFRVERRIEIDQVNALGRDAVAENL